VIPVLLRDATTVDADVATAAAVTLTVSAACAVSAIAFSVRGVGHEVQFDDDALALAVRAVCDRQLHLIAIESRTRRTPAVYRDSELAQRELDHALTNRPVVFFEINAASWRPPRGVLHVTGRDVDGYHVLRTDGPTTPHTVAAMMLELRDISASQCHLHFAWPADNSASPLRCTLLPALTPHRICRCLRSVERDAARRPVVHIDG
jgi:hypothetical protein